METVLPCITESQRKVIQETLARIVESTMPEKIICYGIRTMSVERWSSFSNGSKSEPRISIDLLVVLQEKDKRKRESVSDIIENLSSESIRLITVVHSMDAVNINLEQGNPFFTTLYSNGVLVYDSNRVPLSVPVSVVINNSFNEGNQRKFDLAQMFSEAACDCATDGRNDVAVFLFHQAIELTCIAMLRTCLGYKPTTHSIKKLFMLIENVTQEIEQIFPRSTNEETEIFNILQRAYSDVRYKESYSVSSDKVFTLLERVHEFQAMALATCEKKRNEFVTAKPREHLFIAEYNVPPFESIGLDTFADIVIQKGATESIRIESKEDMEHIVLTKVEDKRLWITVTNDSFDIIPYAIVYVTYRTLSGIVVNHSGNVICKEPIEGSFLGIIQNGKSHIDLQVDVSTLDATITKMGGLKISGSADKAHILNTGSGAFEGIELETSEAKVTVKNSGGVSIHVEDELITILEGDGTLTLKGEPRLKRFVMS